MRVWVVAGEYPTVRSPGRGTFVRDQVVALRAAGHEVTVMHRQAPTLRPLAGRVRALLARRHPGARPAGLSQTGAAGRPSPGGGVIRKARRAARTVHDAAGAGVAVAVLRRAMLEEAGRHGRPDVVHAHNVRPAGVAAVAIARRLRVPVVVTEHSTAYLRGQLTEPEIAQARRVLDAADAVIAVGTHQAAALPVTGHVDVVPNVVLLDGQPARAPGVAATGTVVCIGGLTPHKGVHRLVEAYSRLPEDLRARHPLRIVGEGPDAPRLHAQAAREGLPARDVFTGRLGREQVRAELAGAAVLVSASDTETFGVTLIEALAAGVPFLATRSGGPEDIWTPECGLLVPVGDVASLAAALREILTDAGRHTPEADASRRALAEERYSGRAVTAALAAVYQRVAGTRRADPDAS